MIAITIEPTYAQADVKKSSKAAKIGDNYYFVHRVEKGQTIYSIARAYEVTEDNIAKANNLNADDPIKARSELYVPFKGRPDNIEEPKTNEDTTIQGSTIAPFVIKSEVKKPSWVPGLKKNVPKEVVKEIVDSTLLTDFTIKTYSDKIRGIYLLSEYGTNPNERELLNGAFLAAEQLKAEGVDISMEGISDFWFGMPNDISFIVAGEEKMSAAENISKKTQIPVIAPLIAVDKGNGLTMQFAPQNGSKYNKVYTMVNDPAKNVIVIQHETYNDEEANAEMMAVMPAHAQIVLYDREYTASSILQYLSKDIENIIVVPVNHQGSVEDILSKITSLNSLKKIYDIKVIGTNRWKHLNNINPELLFKANVFYPTSYHWDRSNEKMATFFNNYISRYGQMPNAFAMRGYDIIMIMGEAITKWGSNALEELQKHELTPLQTPYSFVGLIGDKMYNNDWVLVNMTPNYTIETK